MFSLQSHTHAVADITAKSLIIKVLIGFFFPGGSFREAVSRAQGEIFTSAGTNETCTSSQRQ
jgi:hypothetical protein